MKPKLEQLFLFFDDKDERNVAAAEETTPNLGQLCFFDHQQGFVLSTFGDFENIDRTAAAATTM